MAAIMNVTVYWGLRPCCSVEGYKPVASMFRV
jgi:hypothetical protein